LEADVWPSYDWAFSLSIIVPRVAWNPADAPKDAQRDIDAGLISFICLGDLELLGVPVGLRDFAARFPKRYSGGQGCDRSLLDRYRDEYALRYNERILTHVVFHPDA
jgi:hypothetical protein